MVTLTSIVITAAPTGLDIDHSGFFVSPINEDTIGGVGGPAVPANLPLGTRMLLYNPSNGEITYTQ